MGERILRMIVALFIGVYVARYLGPERFGLLSYANSFVGLFLALATLGLDGILVRELVKRPERREELLGTAFGLKIVGAILMWLAIVTAVFLTNNDGQTNTLIAIIAFAVLFQAFNVIDFNYQAEVKSKYVVHAQLVQLVISSIAKLILIFIEAPLIWFAWVYCLDAVVLAVGLAIMYLHHSRRGKIWGWQWRWKVAKELLKDSWPLIFSAILVSVFWNIDKVMIKNILDSNKVTGIYSVAVKLSEIWQFIPMIIIGSLFPAIVQSKKDEIKYKKKLQALANFLFITTCLLSLFITIISRDMVYLLYGNDYIGAKDILMICVWSNIFVSLGTLTGRYLIVENLTTIYMLRPIIGLTSNVLLNLILIPVYEGKGAAVATIISQVIAVFLVDLIHYKKMKIILFIKIKSFIGFSSIK